MRLLKRPRTVDELAGRLDVSRRTVERYLRRLEEGGARLVRVGTSCPSRYQVIE
jgi:predicted transcriptional regulator